MAGGGFKTADGVEVKVGRLYWFPTRDKGPFRVKVRKLISNDFPNWRQREVELDLTFERYRGFPPPMCERHYWTTYPKCLFFTEEEVLAQQAEWIAASREKLRQEEIRINRRVGIEKARQRRLRKR